MRQHALFLGLTFCPVCVPVAFAGSLDDAVIALHAKPAAELPISLCPADGEPSYDPSYDNIPCTDYMGQVGEAGLEGVTFGLEYKRGSGSGNGTTWGKIKSSYE